MRRKFTERLTDNLREIADHPSPSSTALAEIRSRIAEGADERDVEVIVLDTENQSTERPPGRRTSQIWRAAAVLAIVGVLGVVVLATDREAPVATVDSATPPTLNAAEVVEAYRLAYNDRDVAALMAVFGEQTVIVGHPASGGPLGSDVTGLEAIRALQEADIDSSSTAEAPYTFTNVEVDGNTVTWDHLWINEFGVRYCASGHEAVVENGLILSWNWPDPALCE